MAILFYAAPTAEPVTETWGIRAFDPQRDYNYAGVTEDAYIHGGASNKDTNYDNYLIQANNTNPNKALIRFTPNQDIGGATVTDAGLYLRGYYYYNIPGGTTASIYRILQNWVESEVTWNSYSTGNSWNTAGCDAANDSGVDDDASYDRHATALDTQVIGSMSEWLRFDVTSIVQGWVDGTIKEYGVLIIYNAGSGSASWASSEVNHASYQEPYLEITYTL